MTSRIDIARGFRSGDPGAASGVLATYLDMVRARSADDLGAHVDAMALQLGDAALDVGSGTGTALSVIAERVGPSGRAVGVDVNAELCGVAERRTRGAGHAQLLVADAHALPFGEGEFAAARVARTLQHVADPALVAAEMARVVRDGGRVIAIEPDWETLVISGRDMLTARAVLDEFRASVRHPTLGRGLAGLFVDAGIDVESVAVKPLLVRDAASAIDMFLLESAVERLGTEAARQWLVDLHEQSAAGALCAVVTGFTVVGTVRRP